MKIKWFTFSWIAVLALCPVALGAQVFNLPGETFLQKDFLPGAVSRGGALGTFYEDPNAAYYNPAALTYISNTKVNIGLSVAILPDDVFVEYFHLFNKGKDFPLYVSILRFDANVPVLGKNNDPEGQVDAQSFLMQLSTGHTMGPLLRWGASLKWLASQWYLSPQSYLVGDFTVMAELAPLKLRAYGGLRNLSLDLNAIANAFNALVSPTLSSNGTTNATTWLPLPTALVLGGQFKPLPELRFFTDISWSLLETFQGQGLDVFQFALGVSWLPVSRLSLNLGYHFRTKDGLGFPALGVDFSFKIGTFPVVAQYAAEPVPHMGFHNYFGLQLHFL